jgi:hypothetical protein
MISNIRNILTAVAIACAATVVVLARADVKTQKDPKFDFTRISTFGWHPQPGEVKILVTKDSQSKAEPVKRTYEPHLMKAVETELTKRGYAAGPPGLAPDFQLLYYVFIATGSMSQQMGQFLPTNATYGLPLFMPQTTALEIYPQGTIVLDAYSPAGGTSIIWRGMVQAKVEEPITEEQRIKRIQGFIKQLVAKFPEKKKK